MNHPIILFDGVCNFCNSSVQFIIRHDRKGMIHFASLQSSVGRKYLEKHSIPSDIDSVVLIDGDKWYIESDAMMKIGNYLGGVFHLLFLLHLVPKGIRNYVYRWFVKRRYQFFGKQESCMLPSKEIRERFIDNE